MNSAIKVSHIPLIFLRPNPFASLRTTLSLLLFHSHSKFPNKPFSIQPSSKPFSTTLTQYPLQYDMVISRPAQTPSPSYPLRRPKELALSKPTDSPESEPEPELDFDDWVDRKLTSQSSETDSIKPRMDNLGMDKSKRKYYNKRRKRMYGSDSEDENRRNDVDGYVELKPEVVEFRTLHKREEELYFYDTFAYPWEKEKHYRMVYKLEKKYFPDQCLDKAFLQPGERNANAHKFKRGVGKSGEERLREKGVDGRDERALVFFDDKEGDKDERDEGLVKDEKIDVSEKKVEEFFKCLKKVPNKDGNVDDAEPFVSTRSSGLPPKWDGPSGTVVLVNKPKG